VTGGLVPLLVLALLLPLATEQATFRAGVQTVAIYATVRDHDGHLVTGLTADAFQVMDSGRRADITVFSSDPQPLSVAIMLDMSGSMGGTFDSVRRSVLAFVDALKLEDRARIGTFGTEIAVGANLTRDRAELLRVLKEEIWAGGGSPGWQAISEAMTSIAAEPGRRVVLTLTDGEFPDAGLAGWVGNRRTIEAQAARQDAALYAIGFEGYHLSSDIVTATENTGGGHFEVASGSDLTKTFTQVAEQLRHQYLIGFSPAVSDGKTHKVEVRMINPKLKVQARRSYVAGTNPVTKPLANR
jgi:Ca-activated chloride channel family protein